MTENNYRLIFFVVTVAVLFTSTSSTSDWKPVLATSTINENRRLVEDRYILPGNIGHYDSSLVGPNSILSGFHQNEQCSISKLSFNQEGYFQYVEYSKKLPDLKEFTMCMWMRFHNHSTDHPLFSYSVGDQSKEILSWVSNTERSSYISLAIAGRTFYRLNYPFKLMRWYHSCQSWNGKTGEWQLWVNGERTGRGFYNRLVGHVIKGGGSAVSGQHHSQLNGEVDHNSVNQRGSFGMMGQITMLQVYRIALTAGKAHKDHKHHHVHHFDHNGAPLDPTTQRPLPTDPSNALLQGRQLPYMVNLNLGNAGLVQAQLNNGIQYSTQFANGQFSPSRTISEQLLSAQIRNPNGPVTFTRQGSQVTFPTAAAPSTVTFLPSDTPGSDTTQFLDFTTGGHLLFKREETTQVRNKRDNPEKELKLEEDVDKSKSKKAVKRGLVVLSDGSLIDDDELLDANTFEQSLLNGLAGFGQNIPVQNKQKAQSEEREPAEAEVRAVMDMCNGCVEEPFEKALVLSWRHVTLKLYRGAQLLYAAPTCKSF